MSTVHAPPGYPYRRATRDIHEPIVGGVASGLARHLGLPVLWVRVGFVLATGLGGLGAALYAGLWMFLPAEGQFDREAPGLESARRGGRRPGRIRRLTDAGPVITLGMLGLGVVFFLEAIFGQGALLWPIVIAVVGIALLWRQADEAQRERWLDSTGRVNPARLVFGGGGWAAYARVGAGVALLLSAIFIVGFGDGSLETARTALIAGGLGIVGLAIVVGPWVFRLASDLTAEREERVRTQERADVAAHLHDSVLQTLALIQKSSGDAATVARLARAQERDLRSWLFAGEATDERSVASALRGVAAEVEDAHGISVDVVSVGDCDMDDTAAPGRRGHPRGAEQRGQARRHPTRRRVRRDRRLSGRRLRARPRPGVRPRGHAGGPLRRPAQHHRPHAAPRRDRRDQDHHRRGHRGAAAPAPRGQPVTEPQAHLGGDRRRPRDVPQRRARRARHDRRRRRGRQGRGGRRRRGGARRSRRTSPTSYSSTCTCPAGEASR